MPFALSADRSDVNDTSGISGTLTVGTSAVEVKVGGSRLVGRQSVRLYNDSSNAIYWSFSASVTTSGSTKGEQIAKGQSAEWDVGDFPIYVIAASAGNIVIVHEVS